MPLWIELLVWLLIVYGAVLTLAVMLLSRRMRWLRLTRLRADKRKEEKSDD